MHDVLILRSVEVQNYDNSAKNLCSFMLKDGDINGSSALPEFTSVFLLTTVFALNLNVKQFLTNLVKIPIAEHLKKTLIL
ncbi:hypothetical protein [Flavobacterium longum]|uniref:hypothetical protein n=1 Tax=Flavobacterium longum TaxID=1299340 RepID=UPI0039EC2601